MTRSMLVFLLSLSLSLSLYQVNAEWLVKQETFSNHGTLVFNSSVSGGVSVSGGGTADYDYEYDQHIKFALGRTYKDSDGEAADAMEHFFYGQRNGIAMELGGLDGSFKTG